jgi:hypothetical protein
MTPDTSRFTADVFVATSVSVTMVDALRLGCDQFIVVRLVMVAESETDKLMKEALSLDTFVVLNTNSDCGTPPNTLLLNDII